LPTEEDIRNLCARLISANEDEALQSALRELQTAMHEHRRVFENKAMHMLLQGKKRAANDDNS
jgi:hypothetical protein